MEHVLELLVVLSQVLLLIQSKTIGEYLAERNEVLEKEDQSYLGSDLALTLEEIQFNQVLMDAKFKELDEAFQLSHFPPSQHFFLAKPQIEASTVFQIIRQMPKGGNLHTHDLSIVSLDWVIANITYQPNLLMCIKPTDENLIFSWLPFPSNPPNCDWLNVAEERRKVDPVVFDRYLRSFLSLEVSDPYDTYPDINRVWQKFFKTWDTIHSLISSKPILRDYIWQAMTEMLQDNVQLLEIRTFLDAQYCTNNVTCDPMSSTDILDFFQEISTEFSSANPDFCGLNIILSRSRINDDLEDFPSWLASIGDYQKMYPDLIAGMDIMGQEDLGTYLVAYAEDILAIKETYPNLEFFFHAGETNWQGQATDKNIIDGILLGASRLGHGYAITRHPEAWQMALDQNVAIEICPLSNQVLTLVHDLRNHPASVLIQSNFTGLVIASDDVAMWGGRGLSFDFYETFMGLAGRDMDLRLLKKLSLNSIEYSALRGDRKRQCLMKFENKWEDFLSSYISPVD
ncbi:adenosine deaminase 2-like [Tigriopus californicus]|uniref:adenosine deaminase 2-like n=1 Tax=Tigriopus californicus TaxID=6832 RepID=UPI0027DA6C43|nr:adenosine deaminase 2-like [Tigriopus californicus]|eukprot:TCALIF_05130-PA protein Name:"Similar to cecr1 Adenosine deaminase CECR1 (Xenopus laevis)" AED:0.39 eAED:0.39 QI:0/-1/0/1/-1/1/1/0/512